MVACCRQVLEEGSDWRGRAQRIHILKDRLLNLHETLHAQVGVMFAHLVAGKHSSACDMSVAWVFLLQPKIEVLKLLQDSEGPMARLQSLGHAMFSHISQGCI